MILLGNPAMALKARPSQELLHVVTYYGIDHTRCMTVYLCESKIEISPRCTLYPAWQLASRSGARAGLSTLAVPDHHYTMHSYSRLAVSHPWMLS